jgi:hypothetical protein
VSVCDPQGVQVPAEDWRGDDECAWITARVIIHDGRLSEQQRMRLVWAVLDSVADAPGVGL